jgi:CHAT domain-containing protein
MHLRSIVLLLFFLFFNVHFSFAFQEPIEAYTFEIPELDKLILQVNEELDNEQFDQAIQTYQTLQKKCWDSNLDSVAIDLYENIFNCVFIKMQGLEYSLAVIDSFKQQEKDPSFLGIYYGALAYHYIYYGQIDSMKKYYILASEIYNQQHRYLQLANLNINLASEYYYIEQIPSALIYLQKAEKLDVQKLRPRNYAIPNMYNVQTLIYFHLQEYEKAIQSSFATISYEKKKGLSSDDIIAYEYNNLASIFNELNDYENALDYYQRALLLAPKRESSSILYNIAEYYRTLNQIDKAKKFYFEGLKQASLDNFLSSQENLININQALAHCYRDEEKMDSFLFYINQTAEINQSTPYRISDTYKLYSLYFIEQKDLKQAKAYAFKALNNVTNIYNMKSREVASSYDLISDICFHSNDYLEALKYNQKSIESLSTDFSDEEGFSNPKLEQVLDKNTFLSFLNQKMTYIHVLYNQNHPKISQDDLYQTAKLATETIEQLNKVIKNRKSQQDWLNKEAIPAFEQAIQIALSIYKKTNEFKYINEAFILSERSKSMLMQGNFQNKEAAALGGVPTDLILKEKSLQRKISEIQKKRLDAKLNYNFERMESMDSLAFGYKHQLIELLHLFEFDYPDYYKLKYTLKNTGIKDIQAILDQETTLIEYFEGKANLYVFSITKDAAKVHTIKKPKTYNADIFNFRATLTDIRTTIKSPLNHYNKFIEASYKFHQIYLEKSLNTSSKRLIIIPDGQLSYLPFEVFLSEEVLVEKDQTITDINYAKLPYLLRKYKINYNYSATLFMDQLKRKKGNSNGNILAFAPSYKNKVAASWRNPYEKAIRKELIELPGASEELNSLKSIFKGNFFELEQATEYNFKKEMTNYGILHFALHGLADSKNSDFSGLVFYEDQNKIEDNILYAYEIKQLNLEAELVVLSACETGIGLYQSGEGILSLGRDFMYAGVPSILSTLWNLNDYSGSIIIKNFYTNLHLGMEKDEAIRQAKLHYLDQYNGVSSHPFFWACFVQVGDYKSIPIHKNYRVWYIGLTITVFLALILFLFFRFRKK